MNSTWNDAKTPAAFRLTPMRMLSVLLRGVPLFFLVFGGLITLLLLRLIERPLYGAARPFTPAITVFVCRSALVLLGIRLQVYGRPLKGRGAVVANHSSWLDIFVLNASKRIYFVSKAEVARWPGIGWLARATGTVFIERDRAQAAAQAHLFSERLSMGHKLLFFPEGTSSDGQRILPFKTTLFAAFFAEGLKEQLSVQPATVSYTAPEGQDARFFAWWGDMNFGSHLLKVLAAGQGGEVAVHYHAPISLKDMADRKSLARSCEFAIRNAFEAAGQGGTASRN